MESDIPLSTDDLFGTYSITKLVTAAATLLLVADGLLQLDAPVNRYLRSGQLPSDTVTIRHLLAHTAGVRCDVDLWVEEVSNSLNVAGTAFSCKQHSEATHEYSNAGYAVLGQALSDASGMDYSQLVTERVFAPLAMTTAVVPRRHPVGAGHAIGYDAAQGVVRPAPRKIPRFAAAGGMWATASDVCRLAAFSSLIPARLVAETFAPQSDASEGRWQGLGPRVVRTQRGLVAGHAGGGVGYSTSLLFDIERGDAVAVLTNRRGLSVEPLAWELLDAVD